MKTVLVASIQNTFEFFSRASSDEMIFEDLLPDLFVESQLTCLLVYKVEKHAVQCEDKLE